MRYIVNEAYKGVNNSRKSERIVYKFYIENSAGVMKQSNNNIFKELYAMLLIIFG